MNNLVFRYYFSIIFAGYITLFINKLSEHNPINENLLHGYSTEKKFNKNKYSQEQGIEVISEIEQKYEDPLESITSAYKYYIYCNIYKKIINNPYFILKNRLYIIYCCLKIYS